MRKEEDDGSGQTEWVGSSGEKERESFSTNAAELRYGTLMHELRALGVRNNFVINEAWNRYREYCTSKDFKARSEKASQNRKMKSVALALDRDEDDEVIPNYVFLHVHMKDHDGVTFIDNRLARFHVRECSTGRVYGLGSLANRKRRYEDPGAGTSQEPMVQRSELDAVVQRLAKFEAFVQSQLGMHKDFGASTFQAPPPPPPQEHHQQFEMDPSRSPHPQHDDDDEDNHGWLDVEHLGDESYVF
ncbi:hypothetical protein Syun_027803 [Stephania yunnanensis]|uniref:Uncharacterized protein n=1 Tax=Stephania yunnanensis TaxID=152371 RepID=A0AAP0HQ97_9MAGN